MRLSSLDGQRPSVHAGISLLDEDIALSPVIVPIKTPTPATPKPVYVSQPVLVCSTVFTGGGGGGTTTVGTVVGTGFAADSGTAMVTVFFSPAPISNSTRFSAVLAVTTAT